MNKSCQMLKFYILNKRYFSVYESIDNLAYWIEPKFCLYMYFKNLKFYSVLLTMFFSIDYFLWNEKNFDIRIYFGNFPSLKNMLKVLAYIFMKQN